MHTSFKYIKENCNALVQLPSSNTAVKICRHLIGHGAAINEVQFHPVHRRLLASASKDLTIKIWNIYSEVQVFICGGLHGHRDEVGDSKITVFNHQLGFELRI
jgi:WD40 repeat protein